MNSTNQIHPHEKQLQDAAEGARRHEEKAQASLLSLASKTYHNPAHAVLQMMNDSIMQGPDSTLSNLRHEPQTYGLAKSDQNTLDHTSIDQLTETFAHYQEASLNAQQAEDELECYQNPFQAQTINFSDAQQRSQEKE